MSSKITKITITPLKGKSYSIGEEGGESITIIQAHSGQYIQSNFSPSAPDIKALQTPNPKTPFAKKKPEVWTPTLGLGSDEASAI